jgi:uncharacterized protein YjbI with pentapeptide repeats
LGFEAGVFPQNANLYFVLTSQEYEAMANPEHLEKLKQGIEKWNEWRKANEGVEPDLSGADLHGTDLSNANFSKTNLGGANLSGANLRGAILSGSQDRNSGWEAAYMGAADLRGADLSGANLRDADLRGISASGINLKEADLTGATLAGYTDRDGERWGAVLYYANLKGANLSGVNMNSVSLDNADLSGANLSHANLFHVEMNNANLTRTNLTGAYLQNVDLTFANLAEANFSNADLSNSRIYGISAWNVTLENAIQNDLVISKRGESHATVDDLEVAQFIHLILNNTKLRNVINTVTSKAVLILGRFADQQRKAVLDGLRDKLRQFDLLPIVFDFDAPSDKDYTETVQTLAGLSMFVIADLTSPKSTPLELEATVKHFKIPYIPILDVSVDPRPFAMLVDLQKSFHWVLPVLKYESKEDLLDDENLQTYIIDRAMAKREELRKAKSLEPEAILIRKKSA